jgi:DNA-binding response OmpR family regulator
MAPVVISVGEPGLAFSLEIAIRAHGMDTILHIARDGLSGLPLKTYSTLIVDSQVLPRDPARFVDRLRRQSWRGRLIILIEDVPSQAMIRLRSNGAVLIEKPFGSAELIAELERE